MNTTKKTVCFGWAPKAGHIGPRLLGHRCQGTAVGATHVPDLIGQIIRKDSNCRSSGWGTEKGETLKGNALRSWAHCFGLGGRIHREMMWE